MYGYTGKILRIDLGSRKISIDEKDEKFYREFLGGSNIVAHYLLTELPRGIDAFDKENIIVIATSPFTGTSFPGSGRFSIGCKSPLTDGIANSEGGGYFGPQLKFAGYDGIVITGKSESPCYIWINDDKVEIRDGRSVWGKTTLEAENLIRSEVAEPRCKVLQIGIAGENLVRFAAVTNELAHWCGRGGVGAVMGSKNLRAIAVKGTGKVETHDPDKMKEFVKWFNAAHKQNESMVFKSKYGTLGGFDGMDAMGLLPTSNFRKGSFEHAEVVGGIHLAETILTKTDTCYACPVACKRVVDYKDDDMIIDGLYGGPEYDSMGSLASNCEIGSQKHACKANELCNMYGLDTISMGVTTAFAMECFEKGLLTKKDTDGLDLSFGNGESFLKVIEMTAHREGIGNVLAEGSWRAARTIGNGAEKFSMTAKKQEFPAHDPRGKWGVGLGYAISPTGADHLIAAHDPWFELEPDTEHEYTSMDITPMYYFGIREPIPAMSLDAKKLRLFVHLQYLWSLYNVIDVCIFEGVPEYRMISIEQLVDAINSITGWDMSVWEAVKIGEKAIQLSRLFNLRSGLSAKDDTLPERMFEPLLNGAHEGDSINKADFDKAVSTYYEMMGWDKEGWPTYGKFAELGLEDLFCSK